MIREKNKLFLLCTLVILIGLLAVMATPIFLLISLGILKEILPNWFMVTTIVLSALDIVSLTMIVLTWIFDKDPS